MFTRSDYFKFITLVQDLVQGHKEQEVEILNKVMNFLQKDNPRFKPERFLKAYYDAKSAQRISHVTHGVGSATEV